MHKIKYIIKVTIKVANLKLGKTKTAEQLIVLICAKKGLNNQE